MLDAWHSFMNREVVFHMQKKQMQAATLSDYARRISALCALVLLPALFTACGNKASNAQQTNTPASQQTKDAQQQGDCPAPSSEARRGQTLYVGRSTARSGPEVTVVTALDVRDGKTIWQTTIAQTGRATVESLQLVDGIIYAIHAFSSDVGENVVTALDAKDGHIVWRYKAENQMPIARVVVCSDVMYLTYMKGTLGHDARIENGIEARRLKDTSLLWRYNSPDILLDSAFTGNSIYVLTATIRDSKTHATSDIQHCLGESGWPDPTRCEMVHTLSVLDTSNGQPLWHSSPYITPFYPYNLLTLTATEQAVYITHPNFETSASDAADAGVFADALRANDGSVLWQHVHVDISGAGSTTAVFNDILYLTGLDQVAAISVHDGKQLWKSTGVHSVELNTGNGFLYTDGLDYPQGPSGQSRHRFCALHAASGKQQWCTDNPNAGFVTVASQSAVYSSSANHIVVALQQSDGKEIWHYAPAIDRQIFGMILD
jgi:outer membrane protein assembly factor BamB